MNEGRYPDEVINYGVARLNKGGDPKDVADEINEKYRYSTGRPSPESLRRWHKAFPMGKEPKSLPPGFMGEVAGLVEQQFARRQDTDERRPATPLQQKLYARCQTRSNGFPDGDHAWIEDVRFAEGYTLNRLPTEEMPASPDDAKKLGYVPDGWRKCTTTRTCWFCPYTTEPVSTWWPVDPLAEVFSIPLPPC